MLQLRPDQRQQVWCARRPEAPLCNWEFLPAPGNVLWLTHSLTHHLQLGAASGIPGTVSKQQLGACSHRLLGCVGTSPCPMGWDMLKSHQVQPTLCLSYVGGLRKGKAFGQGSLAASQRFPCQNPIPDVDAPSCHRRTSVCHSFPAPEGSTMEAGWIRN